MPTVIRHYYSITAGNKPTYANMPTGRLAMNNADGAAYIARTSDSTVIDVRTLRTYPSVFGTSFTLLASHVFGYLRVGPNSMTITIPTGLMAPGEHLLLRWLPNLLQSLTVQAAAGVTVNGTSGGSQVTGAASATVRIQCFATNVYDVF